MFDKSRSRVSVRTRSSRLMGVNMGLRVYLSGEIHTDWREQIVEGAAGLDVEFSEKLGWVIIALSVVLTILTALIV